MGNSNTYIKNISREKEREIYDTYSFICETINTADILDKKGDFSYRYHDCCTILRTFRVQNELYDWVSAQIKKNNWVAMFLVGRHLVGSRNYKKSRMGLKYITTAISHGCCFAINFSPGLYWSNDDGLTHEDREQLKHILVERNYKTCGRYGPVVGDVVGWWNGEAIYMT